jgi:hypothetical protein
MAGVGLRAVQELRGWEMLKRVERYSHLKEEHEVGAVKILANIPQHVSQQPKQRLLNRSNEWLTLNKVGR